MDIRVCVSAADRFDQVGEGTSSERTHQVPCRDRPTCQLALYVHALGDEAEQERDDWSVLSWHTKMDVRLCDVEEA